MIVFRPVAAKDDLAIEEEEEEEDRDWMLISSTDNKTQHCSEHVFWLLTVL